MAVFRVERTKDYTVMSNHHLKNMNLSLKAKGLLSMMLSLPDSWNYTTRGLAAICKEGVDAIRSAIQELERAGYIVRRLLRGGNGRITDTEYVIYEQPQGPDTAPPEPERPDTRPPQAGGPDMSQPDTGNSYAAGSCAAEPDSNKAAQLNTNSSIKNQSNTQRTNTHSIHPPLDGRADAGMSEGICAEDILAMREQIQDQIDYDYLVKWEDPKQIDELVELMLEVELATDPAISIGRGKQYPTALVRERFRLITSDHIVGIQDSLRENRTQVRNPKAYLLAALFNAPTSTSSQTAMQVNCDYPRRC